MLKKQTLVFLSTFAAVVLFSGVAFAQDAGADNVFTAFSWVAIASALAIGVAALGAALGMGRAGTAALEGIARNPGAAGKIFTPLIITLALIEAVAIYGLLIAFVLSGNLQLPADMAELIQVIELMR